ncbi:DUF421 domain-containing protein [Spirosoma luteum]|uniref:DUF421 domain-containing protein n=1 Tax=Spirosoma luteum TaxID=431553 RepID=UPI000366CC7E|nr:YetF domain-containing protein [Spirosoma luteum]
MNDYELTDWHRILLGELPGQFLLEVGVRTLIMFVVIFISLRATGKTTVRQLTIVNLVLIVGLGSAAGDPMFYHDVGILPALLVFGVVVFAFRALTRWAATSTKASDWVQGKTILLIEDGQFAINELKKEQLGQDEFFMELREGGIEHLGQVRRAYLESSGDVSLFFYEDDQVKSGLPILPELFNKKSVQISKAGLYACSFCGQVENLQPQESVICPHCQHKEWVPALKTRRVT